MRILFLLLFGVLYFGTAQAQSTILTQSAYSNDTIISVSPRAITDTATTKNWLIYGDGTANFVVKALTYFNGTWSDTLTIDSVDMAVSGPFILQINSITTDSLKRRWLPSAGTTAPYTHTILKAKNGWMYKLLLSMWGTGNSGVVTIDEIQ